jgi:hypothetical protein
MREMLGIGVDTYKAITHDRLRVRGIRRGTVSYAHSKASGGDSSIEVSEVHLGCGFSATMRVLEHEKTHVAHNHVKAPLDSPSERLARAQAEDFERSLREAAAYNDVKSYLFSG